MYNTLMQNNVFFALFWGEGGGQRVIKMETEQVEDKRRHYRLFKKKEKKKHMLCLTVMSFKK